MPHALSWYAKCSPLNGSYGRRDSVRTVFLPRRCGELARAGNWSAVALHWGVEAFGGGRMARSLIGTAAISRYHWSMAFRL